jgi:hypothetical protein
MHELKKNVIEAITNNKPNTAVLRCVQEECEYQWEVYHTTAGSHTEIMW